MPPARYTPEKDVYLDEIFDLIGVERVKRQYDGINAICCGVELAGPNLKLFPRGKNFEPFREKNIQDARNHGAEAIVCADELYEVILIVWPYDLPQAALKPAVLWGEKLIAALRNMLRHHREPKD